MGLFDVFKSEPPKLTARLALPAGLLYMMAADGELKLKKLVNSNQLLAVIKN